MAFLYSTYIVIYAIAQPLLGRYIDSVYNRTGGSRGGDVHGALVNIAGVQFTVLTCIVIAATFVPRGALAFNPKMLEGERLDKEVTAETSMVQPGEAKGMEAVHQTQVMNDASSEDEDRDRKVGRV